ncbi:hypothetical protein C8R45DRAFT_599700 [Mycena sanguinolenta]|nr:hypothetical protein C8R45DRAFT_599700 [Mycena sanguinolenta]
MNYSSPMVSSGSSAKQPESLLCVMSSSTLFKSTCCLRRIWSPTHNLLSDPWTTSIPALKVVSSIPYRCLSVVLADGYCKRVRCRGYLRCVQQAKTEKRLAVPVVSHPACTLLRYHLDLSLDDVASFTPYPYIGVSEPRHFKVRCTSRRISCADWVLPSRPAAQTWRSFSASFLLPSEVGAMKLTKLLKTRWLSSSKSLSDNCYHG